MTRVRVEITMSLDGYVAGPAATLEAPLGAGGEQLHEWLFRNASWRARHGLGGGDGTDADNGIVDASVEATGAYVMGRKMFSGGEGPWESDPNPRGWWGDDPPFHLPVFVLTHHEREPLALQGGTTFTFVTGGIEAAIEQARSAAADRDVLIAGGADVARQAVAAGLVDELTVHVAPVLLGDGVRLFDSFDAPIELSPVDVANGPIAAHLTYRIGGHR